MAQAEPDEVRIIRESPLRLRPGQQAIAYPGFRSREHQSESSSKASERAPAGIFAGKRSGSSINTVRVSRGVSFVAPETSHDLTALAPKPQAGVASSASVPIGATAGAHHLRSSVSFVES